MFKFIGKLIKFSLVFCVAIVVGIVALAMFLPSEEERLAEMTPQERTSYLEEKAAKKVAEAKRDAEETKEKAKRDAERKAAKVIADAKSAEEKVERDRLAAIRLAEQKVIDKKEAAEDAKKAAKATMFLSALALCKKSVREQAKFKSKVDFSYKRAGDIDMATGEGSVGGRVELMNGFGLMIPQLYVCKVEDFKVFAALLANG